MVILILPLLLPMALHAGPKNSKIKSVGGVNPNSEGMLVELTGVVQTGMMAIGGETTGTILTTPKGETYELMLDKNSAAIKSGNKVRVKGTLSQIRGVEIRNRKIIRVIEINENSEQ